MDGIEPMAIKTTGRTGGVDRTPTVRLPLISAVCCADLNVVSRRLPGGRANG